MSKIAAALSRKTLLSSRHLFASNNWTIPMSTAASMDTDAQFPVASAITRNLREAFHPTHLEVINESYKHKVYVVAFAWMS